MTTTETIQTATTSQFLDDIHGPDADIYFNVGGKTWKNKPQTYEEAETKLKWLNDDKNKDIYFIPNSGGTTNAEIDSINAVFGDWDAGKDENGAYFPLEIVKQKKTDFFITLEASPLAPSYVVDTRNGYQPYWLLYPGSTVEQFIDAQKRIAYYFKADPVVITPCHVMRLPGYYWLKPKKNCAPYYVDIIVDNPVRYYISHILQAFPVISDEEYEDYRQTVKKPTNSRPRIGAHNNSFSYKVSTLDIYVGTYPQEHTNKTASQEHSIIDQLKRQNMAEYLKIEYEGEMNPDISITLECLFHEDKTPSATIFIDEKGCYRYHCHSSDCGFTGSIIDVVMEQDNISTGEAVSRLLEYYHIENDTTWIDEQKEMLSQNIATIENLNEHKDEYPDLYRVIGRIRRDLLSKLSFARDNVALKTSRNENIIICSLRQFQQLISPMSDGTDLGRQNERVDRYCLLGLMRKLHDDEVNSALLAGAYEVRDKIADSFKKSGRKTTNLCRVQLYTIPEYTDELLQHADKIAKCLKECGVRMNAISRDLILQIFGKEEALRIYPQIQTEEVSEKGQDLMARIEGILLDDLESMGYSSVGRIVERIHTYGKWKTVTDRRVKRYIPGLLKKCNLMERTANKELKTLLGIETKGYPKVIVKESDIRASTKGV